MDGERSGGSVVRPDDAAEQGEANRAVGSDAYQGDAAEDIARRLERGGREEGRNGELFGDE